jgi:hypothetical protein
MLRGTRLAETIETIEKKFDTLFDHKSRSFEKAGPTFELNVSCPSSPC